MPVTGRFTRAMTVRARSPTMGSGRTPARSIAKLAQHTATSPTVVAMPERKFRMDMAASGTASSQALPAKSTPP